MIDKQLLKNFNITSIHSMEDISKIKTWERIRRGETIQITWSITKRRKQKIKGVCKRIKLERNHPTITIQYKLSGELLEQTFPLYSKSLASIQTIKL